MKGQSKLMPMRIIILSLLIVLVMIASSQAGWLIYHEPSFKGTVFDIETKQPVEGAVVVVVYEKRTMGLGAGTISSIIDIRETLTDKQGNFHIPSYTTLIQPFSWQIPNQVIIYKPGYAKEETIGRWPFENKVEMHMQEQPCSFTPSFKCKYSGNGIIEIPKLKTREERMKVDASPVGQQSDWRKQKQFIKAIRDEWQYLYNQDPRDLYNVK
jgi:hypothetical protein